MHLVTDVAEDRMPERDVLRDLPPDVKRTAVIAFLDHLCDNSPTAEIEDSGSRALCEVYKSAKHAKLFAIGGLILMPVVPVMLSIAVAIIRARKTALSSSAALWLLLKGVNKIIGFETVPLAFAIGFSLSAAKIPHVWCVLIALFIAGILWVLKASLIESYTEGALELEIKLPEPDFKSAASA